MILGFKIFQNIFRITWLLGIFIILISFESFAQDPFIPKYNAIKRSERCFTITEDQNDQFGAVWFRNRGNFGQDTTLYFVVYMGDKDGGGADGLAFVMHDDPRDTLFDGSITYNIGGQTFNQQAATGEPGGGLGYGNHHSQGHNLWIEPSVAVEFDTWDNNPDVLDGNAGDGLAVSPHNGEDHTSVVYNGDMANGYQMIEDENGVLDRMHLLKPPSHPAWATDANIEDNGCYAYKINWIVNSDGTQTLELWADVYNENIVDAEDYTYYLVMRHTDDMINGVFGGETSLRFGFTGSTGGSRNEQTICLLGGNTRPVAKNDFANTPVNTPVVIDVESNDQDFDGDNLFVPVIITAPTNGTATVINDNGDNPIQYTPDANFVGTDTIEYRTCDVDSDKCYALCDRAYAIVTVGCNEISIGAAMTDPYTLCQDTLAPNGAAEAFFVSGTARGDFWVETFSGMNNATDDTGTSAWSFSTSGGCNGGNNIRVQGDMFRAQNTGCEVIWESEVIDISPQPTDEDTIFNINISIYLEADGDMESADYLEVYYILDGGAEVPLNNGVFTDNFGSATASAVGLQGNTLQIRIRARNSAGNESYFWDDLYITAEGPASPPSLTYHWYEGSVSSGNFLNTGQIMGGLRDTTYFVYAIDDVTGCISDTVSVDILNQPEPVDSIVIEQISPFTKCELPYDGELSAGVIEGTDTVTTGYTFEWRYLSDPGTATPIRVGAVASNLEATEYRLTVINQATGCLANVTDSVTNEVRTPTVFPQVLSDVYSCADPNSGIVFATDSLDGAYVSDVTHYWYEGIIADLSNPEDYVGDTITNLPPGDYAVISVDNVTGCNSESRSVNIQDLRENPVPVVTDATEQISCDPSAPTGSFTSVVDDGGSNVTSGFTFNWYRGLNDVTPARPGYTDGPDVDQLPADQYRLIVTNDTSGCFAVLDTAIIENITYPELDTAVATNVTVCGPAPNGTITATPVGAISDFNYRLYSGFGVVPANLITEQASNVFTGLDVANYTVTIVDAVTNCESNSKGVSVQDATVDPTANFDVFPQIACAPADPTGRVTASVTTGTVNDYTFEWFANDTSGTQLFSTRGVNNEILDTLAVGQYALLLTDNATQCQNVYYQNISPSITLPVIDNVLSNPSTNCAPDFNGVLSATADGGQTDPNIFTFTWRDSLNNIVSTDYDPDDLAPGDYELVVTNDTTLCSTNPYPINVDDQSITPNVIITPTDNSSCDVANPNGQLEVTDVTNEGVFDPLNYSYAWYEGTSSSSGTQLVTPNISFPNDPDSSLVFGLSENTFALVITNKNTNCSNEVLSSLIDINIKPVLDYPNIVDATRCTDPYMSSVEIATVNGGQPIPSGYSFRLENVLTGDIFTNTSGLFEDNTDSDGIVLPPGDEYRIIALNSFNCPSDTIEFEIQDDSTDPVFSLDVFDNTSCDPGLPNGIVVVSTDGSYPVNQIEWFITNTSGSDVSTISTASIIRDDSVATGLPLNDYAVRVTADNGCNSVEFATVDEVTANKPLLDSLYAENLTSCIIDNGLIGLGVSPLELLPPDLAENRTYTFTIDNSGTTLNRTTEPSHADSVNFINLAQGDWQATVTDDYTHCVSDPLTISLQQAPEIVFDVLIDSKPSGCVANTGQLTISAETPGFNEAPSDAGFDFTWYEGSTIGGPIVGTVITPSADDWTSSANQLTAGYFTVEVFDRSTSCVRDTSVFLNRELPPIIDNVSATNATDCDPANGELFITIDPTTFPVGRSYANYDFLVFEGIKFDENWNTVGTTEYQVVEGPSVPVGGPVTFAPTFEAGTYIVVARERFGSNCFTDPEIVNIDLDYVFPNTNFTVVSDNTCAGALNGTGSLEEDNLVATDYDFQWHTGSTIGSPIPGEINQLLSDRLSGNYTLYIEVVNGPGLGCDTVKTIPIPKVKDTVELVVSTTNNFNCAPNFNGTIEVTDVLTNSVSSGLGGFADFTIKDDGNNDITGTTTGDGTTTPWSDLDPSSYYLTARNTTTNCITKTYKADILNLKQNPTLNLTMDVPDFSCNDLVPTGEITATASPAPTGSYSWQWEDASGNLVTSTDAATSSNAINLSDGTYTIIVTDNDGDGVNEGCSTTRNFTLTQGNISIVTPLVTSTNRTICDDNASIVVNEIVERRNGTIFNTETPAYADYAAVLYDDNLDSISVVSEPWAVFYTNGRFGSSDQVPVGKYYVKARNITTGCNYGPPTQVIIKDVSKKPLVSITMETPDYACLPSANHTGVLATVATGGSDGDAIASNFNYTWTDLSNNPITTDGGTPPRAIDLPEGDYKLVVEDANGLDEFCQTTRTFSVTHELQEIVIVSASGTDQTWCNPNGTLQIDSLVVNGAGVGPSDPTFIDYLINLYEGDLNTPFGPTDNLGLPGDPIDSISANNYFAIATNNQTLCESYPRQVIIDDETEDPIVDLTKTSDNYSLNYGNPNSLTGALTAEAFENDGSVGANGYNYEWYRNELGNNDSLFATASGVSTIQTHTNLRDAIYHVRVENDQTKCITVGAINLPFVYLKPKFNPVATAQTFCMPPNGEINIPSIYKVPDSTEVFSKYFFDWHIGDYDESLPDSVKAGSPDGNRLRGLQAGAYYVHALDTFWMVESDPVKVTVEDSTTYPMMSFNSSLSDDQTSCNDNDPNGALSILMQGFDTYTFAWYEGPSATGTPIANSETITGYPAGTYTFTATSNMTGCTTEKSYNIVDNIKIPVLATSTSPVTNCVPELANGIASANINNIVNSTYDFYWYEGMSESGTPVYTDLSGVSGDNTYSAYTNISAGYYTVVAQDTFDCKSDPMTIQVINNLKFPLITYDELSPLTHCDPDKANAVFSALADGKATGYTFQWNIQNGPQYASGPIVNNLGDTTYTLLVTNNVTGCTSIEDIRPSVAFRNVPNPLVDVLNHRTSCISPNGEAESYVNALMENFDFTYLGPNQDLELVNPVNGTTVSELGVNSYYVFAKERTSGCISDTVLFTIEDGRYVPDYDVITEPSNCVEPTGSGEVIITDQSRPYEVRWYKDDIPLGAIREIFYQPAGEYFVAVEGTEGCIDSAQVEIPTDILIFNGVSDNSDGLNDIFHLECIYLFPNNNVKLFNRAGELVYEMDHYDNEDPNKRFRGLSNKGPVNGNELAIGTYYYVIDKGDGSKPLVGYLELNR